MALIYDGIRCAICRQRLDVEGKLIATPHFIADPADPLAPYSDAAMHYDCFQQWEHREAFVEKYNQTMIAAPAGRRDHMEPDGRIVPIRPAK